MAVLYYNPEPGVYFSDINKLNVYQVNPCFISHQFFKIKIKRKNMLDRS